MEGYILEWLNFLGRWFHMITGIAWIGASFYFIWLDSHLRTPRYPEEADRLGLSGEVWALHGGGFYRAQKFKIAPPEMPEPLHWFKWEAYTTWLSGMFLMILIYYVQADVYLIDKRVASLTHMGAVLLGLVFLALGWIIYDVLCRTALSKNEPVFAAILFALSGVAAYLLCSFFSGRGAFIHFGAMLGTIMAANVFFVIMPGQREMVKAKAENRVPDPKHAANGKLRSVHNTYFTMPVLNENSVCSPGINVALAFDNETRLWRRDGDCHPPSRLSFPPAFWPTIESEHVRNRPPGLLIGKGNVPGRQSPGVERAA